jgi:ribonuclease D
MTEVSVRHNIPTENLLTPDLMRRLAWSPPSAEVAEVSEYLLAAGARPWQVGLVGAGLAAAMADPA